MSIESAIDKLQIITKVKGSIEEWTQTKAGGGSRIVEKNINRKIVEKSKKRRHVEYVVIGYEVVIVSIIIFRLCKRKNVQWENAICINDNSRYI